MGKELTLDDVNEILRGQTKYFIQRPEDGKVIVEFETNIYKVEKGDVDFLGNTWNHDWDKYEAKAKVNGEPKVYSFGSRRNPFLREFLNTLKMYNLTPNTLSGTKWEIEFLDNFKYNIKLLNSEEATPNVDVEKVIDAIKKFKELTPELVSGGMNLNDLKKVVSIRASIKADAVDGLLPELQKRGIIKIEGDKVFIL